MASRSSGGCSTKVRLRACVWLSNNSSASLPAGRMDSERASYTDAGFPGLRTSQAASPDQEDNVNRWTVTLGAMVMLVTAVTADGQERGRGGAASAAPAAPAMTLTVM